MHAFFYFFIFSYLTLVPGSIYLLGFLNPKLYSFISGYDLGGISGV